MQTDKPQPVGRARAARIKARQARRQTVPDAPKARRVVWPLRHLFVLQAICAVMLAWWVAREPQTGTTRLEHFTGALPPALPLARAAFDGEVKVLESLLASDPAAITRHDRVTGQTALHWAVQGDRCECVAVLLANGADVNCRAKRKLTPLHIAASRNNVKSLKLLIAAGADVSATTDAGETAAAYATRYGADDAVSMLEAHRKPDRGCR